ncbi:hypothetical protein [uncultured Paracoccus sp.]|nr:hypothetical protein [uncultured Paracoccus sp.]
MPSVDRGRRHDRASLSSDLAAAIIVTVVLIPSQYHVWQAMTGSGFAQAA